MTWTPKPPDSVEDFFWDFNLALADGDNVASIVGPITQELGDSMLVVGAPGIWATDNNVITARISGGTDAKTYELRAEVLTAGGETLSLLGVLLVRRLP